MEQAKTQHNFMTKIKPTAEDRLETRAGPFILTDQNIKGTSMAL